MIYFPTEIKSPHPVYKSLCSQELKYHSSWDWMIPVLAKIQKTIFDSNANKLFYRGLSNLLFDFAIFAAQDDKESAYNLLSSALHSWSIFKK